MRALAKSRKARRALRRTQAKIHEHFEADVCFQVEVREDEWEEVEGIVPYKKKGLLESKPR